MDWANEKYVRVYTRDTEDLLIMGWQSRAVLWEMLRKADRSGVVATKRGAKGIAAVVNIPGDVVEPAIVELVDLGLIVACDDGYLVVNFLEAQETPQTDAQRQRDSRERRRASRLGKVECIGVTNRDRMSRDVTPGHAESHAVTLSSPSEPSEPEDVAQPPAAPPQRFAETLPGFGPPPAPPEKPRKPAKEPAELTVFRDWWLEQYEAATGQKHLWAAKQAGLAKTLISQVGLVEVQRRAAILLARDGPAFLTSFDLGTLVQHFDKLHSASTDSGGARGAKPDTTPPRRELRT
jgi:hypothetical protein